MFSVEFGLMMRIFFSVIAIVAYSMLRLKKDALLILLFMGDDTTL